MSRDLDASALDALNSGNFTLALLVEAEFNSGSVRFWTGTTPIDWNGETWEAAGALLSVSAMPETSEVVSSGFQVTLSGVNPAYVALAIDEARQGQAGRVWLAFVDSDEAIIGEPYRIGSGRLDVPTITDNGESVTVSITYENRLVDLITPRERRLTHEDQKIDYPDDLGFEYVTSIQDIDITWGV